MNLVEFESFITSMVDFFFFFYYIFYKFVANVIIIIDVFSMNVNCCLLSVGQIS